MFWTMYRRHVGEFSLWHRTLERMQERREDLPFKCETLRLRYGLNQLEATTSRRNWHGHPSTEPKIKPKTLMLGPQAWIRNPELTSIQVQCIQRETERQRERERETHTHTHTKGSENWLVRLVPVTRCFLGTDGSRMCALLVLISGTGQFQLPLAGGVNWSQAVSTGRPVSTSTLKMRPPAQKHQPWPNLPEDWGGRQETSHGDC